MSSLIGKKRDIFEPISNIIDRKKFQDEIYKIGFSTIKKENDFIKNLGENIQKSYRSYLNNLREGTTKNAGNMLNGMIFSLGSKEFGNSDWRRHVSSSLRELVYVFPQHKFNDHYSRNHNNGNKLNSNKRSDIDLMWKHYEYFSGIHHNEEVGITESAKSIDSDIKLEIQDVLLESYFVNKIISFLELLYKLFR